MNHRTTLDFKIGDRVRLAHVGGDPESVADVGDLGSVAALLPGINCLEVRMDDGHITRRAPWRWEPMPPIPSDPDLLVDWLLT